MKEKRSARDSLVFYVEDTSHEWKYGDVKVQRVWSNCKEFSVTKMWGSIP
jgi:hypothetical protein